MTKRFYYWLFPLFIAVLVVGNIWFVADPKSFIYFPRDSPWDWLYTLLTIAVFCYFMFYLNMIAIRYFISKKNRIKVIAEYAIIFLYSTAMIALASMSVSCFINHKALSIIELIRNCGLSVPLAFLGYLALRNSFVTEEYNRQMLQLEKTRSNQLETELKYLRAQYHPHFLFNALNTVYFRIDDQNTEAKNTIELLSELLRYQLYNIEEKVDVSEEINFIKTYIRFQQLRMTKRLVMNVFIDEALNSQKIYPLIYQPFFENAFKYVGGEYWINLEMKLDDKQIIFRLENSLPEKLQQTKKSNSGIGIENIKRRLALLYPDRHRLNIKQDEKSFGVELIINLNSG